MNKIALLWHLTKHPLRAWPEMKRGNLERFILATMASALIFIEGEKEHVSRQVMIEH